MNDRQPARTKLGFIVATVFLLGLVTGGASQHAYGARAQLDGFEAALSGSRHGVLIWSLDRKLDLSAEQAHLIERILSDYDHATDALRGPVDPRIAALKEQMRRDVRSTLTPEQRLEYDNMIAARAAARGRGRPLAVPAASRAVP